MPPKIVDRDHGWRKLKRELERTKDARRVLVGIQGKDGSEMRDDGATNALIASVHEFGSIDGTIPERSFIRATIDDNAREIKAAARKFSIGVIDGKLGTNQALELLGQLVVGMIRKRIRAGIAPPLKQATIDRKGSSKPLIDTGQLVGSISYKVV